jgi:hypothetical protein
MAKSRFFSSSTSCRKKKKHACETFFTAKNNHAKKTATMASLTRFFPTSGGGLSDFLPPQACPSCSQGSRAEAYIKSRKRGDDAVTHQTNLRIKSRFWNELGYLAWYIVAPFTGFLLVYDGCVLLLLLLPWSVR